MGQIEAGTREGTRKALRAITADEMEAEMDEADEKGYYLPTLVELRAVATIREQAERIAELEGRAMGCCQGEADAVVVEGPAVMGEIDELIGLITQGQVSPVSARVMQALRGAALGLKSQARTIGELGHARNEAAVRATRLDREIDDVAETLKEQVFRAQRAEAEVAEQGARIVSLEQRLEHWTDRAGKAEAQVDGLLRGIVEKEDDRDGGTPRVITVGMPAPTDPFAAMLRAAAPGSGLEFEIKVRYEAPTTGM